MPGTWTTQNKVRPGVYLRFRSAAETALTVGQRGVVAICEPLNWGPVAQVTEITTQIDATPYTGYSISDPNNRFLNEIFKGSNRTSAPTKVLLYRPTASASAQATAEIEPLTVTALYPGTRGNDISVSVTSLTEPSGSFLVSTIVDGEVVDAQTVETADELIANEWVTFSGTGTLNANSGTSLSGGNNGTVQSAAYTSFLAAIEPYAFDVLIYDGSDSGTMTAMVDFVNRIAEENGVYAQLVAANLTTPDSRYVINVMSGVTLSDGTVLTPQQTTWWVGGTTAGALYNQDLTYAQYPQAVSVSPLMTNGQYIEADQNGQFTLFADNGVVKVEYDINSLTTYTQDIGEVFHLNRTMRLCNTIANDIYRQFSDNYIGAVNNNDAGRTQFQAAIVGYLLDIQAQNGIENFSADDVQVTPGTAIDAVVVTIGIQPVGSINKIYMTIEVS